MYQNVFYNLTQKHEKYITFQNFNFSLPSVAGLTSRKLEEKSPHPYPLYPRILALETILPNPHFAYEKPESGELTFLFYFILHMCVFVTKIRLLFISNTMKIFQTQKYNNVCYTLYYFYSNFVCHKSGKLNKK